MRQSREELEQRWLRDFPYLPETLYLLIGTRPVMEPDAPLLPTTDLGADLAPL
jgi:hypothetical protein